MTKSKIPGPRVSTAATLAVEGLLAATLTLPILLLSTFHTGNNMQTYAAMDPSFEALFASMLHISIPVLTVLLGTSVAFQGVILSRTTHSIDAEETLSTQRSLGMGALLIGIVSTTWAALSAVGGIIAGDRGGNILAVLAIGGIGFVVSGHAGTFVAGSLDMQTRLRSLELAELQSELRRLATPVLKFASSALTLVFTFIAIWMLPVVTLVIMTAGQSAPAGYWRNYAAVSVVLAIPTVFTALGVVIWKRASKRIARLAAWLMYGSGGVALVMAALIFSDPDQITDLSERIFAASYLMSAAVLLASGMPGVSGRYPKIARYSIDAALDYFIQRSLQRQEHRVLARLNRLKVLRAATHRKQSAGRPSSVRVRSAGQQIYNASIRRRLHSSGHVEPGPLPDVTPIDRVVSHV